MGTDDIVALARRWIGTPYVHQASVRGAGCDCLGLLRGVWRDMGREEPQAVPNYSPDWAEARAAGTGTEAETLYAALARHFTEVPPARLAPGDVALFRMHPRGPAKHCGILAERDGSATLIHARQNKRVSEEPLSEFWRRKLVCGFRIQCFLPRESGGGGPAKAGGGGASVVKFELGLQH
ncbi:MAG TPA: NlpC/P60 family protein [Rhizomicrobium sp.]|nr:NlpC/P60 family protein [Rhizomicrobium sp.]